MKGNKRREEFKRCLNNEPKTRDFVRKKDLIFEVPWLEFWATDVDGWLRWELMRGVYRRLYLEAVVGLAAVVICGDSYLRLWSCD